MDLKHVKRWIMGVWRNKMENKNIEKLDLFEKEIICFCTKLTVKMIKKYRKGKKEHGDNIDFLDFGKEINNEVLDILNYYCMSRASKNH